MAWLPGYQYRKSHVISVATGRQVEEKIRGELEKRGIVDERVRVVAVQCLELG